MAKTSFEIQMDYNRAIAQANSLEQVAEQLKNSAEQDFQDCITEISYNWTGENARAYIEKCNTLKQSIETTARSLKKTAATIQKIAKNTYSAEMKALRLAQERKY